MWCCLQWSIKLCSTYSDAKTKHDRRKKQWHNIRRGVTAVTEICPAGQPEEDFALQYDYKTSERASAQHKPSDSESRRDELPLQGKTSSYYKTFFNFQIQE